MPSHGGTALHGIIGEERMSRLCSFRYSKRIGLFLYSDFLPCLHLYRWLTPLAATYSGNGLITCLLLYYGANYTIENNNGLTARQEAKGDAIDVFTYFQTGKGVFCFIFYYFPQRFLFS
jgi:hypothetical protein